jgi:26S proteasome regulatory subunit N2
VAAALDTYIQRQQQPPPAPSTAGDSGISTDQLRLMIRRLIATSCQAGAIEHAIGIALEAREMDVLGDILAPPSATLDAVRYALHASNCLDSKPVRVRALAITADSLQARFDAASTTSPGGEEEVDITMDGGTSAGAVQDIRSAVSYDLVLVYQRLKQPEKVAAVLTALLESTEEAHGLLALQICFDLMDSGHSDFTKALASHLFRDPDGSGTEGGGDPAGPADAAQPPAAPAGRQSLLWAQAEKVLVGGFASELALSFLHKHSSADRLIMEHLRKSLDERSSRSSILHSAGVVTHSYLYAGTTNDSFLRDYLDWMKKASNWYVGTHTSSCTVRFAGRTQSHCGVTAVSHSPLALSLCFSTRDFSGPSSRRPRRWGSSIPCTLPTP